MLGLRAAFYGRIVFSKTPYHTSVALLHPKNFLSDFFSGKKKSTLKNLTMEINVDDKPELLSEEKKNEIKSAINKDTEDWISFGYSYTDKDYDIGEYNFRAFVMISLCTVILGFVAAYMPDPRMTEWATREAYLELDRRERLGLPHVDPNLVPLQRIQLPSDEELGEKFPIII